MWDGEQFHFSAAQANKLVINAGGGNDHILMTGQAFGQNPTIKINGQDGNDIILGTNGDYKIYGGRGDDPSM